MNLGVLHKRLLRVVCKPRDGGRLLEQNVNLVVHFVKLLDEALLPIRKE